MVRKPRKAENPRGLPQAKWARDISLDGARSTTAALRYGVEAAALNPAPSLTETRSMVAGTNVALAGWSGAPDGT